MTKMCRSGHSGAKQWGCSVDEAFWQGIINSDFAVPPEYTVTDLTPELMSYLGSTDPHLRDEVGFLILAHWIDHGYYTPNELRGMAMHAVQGLATGLGKAGDDTVFLRSYSALVIAAIVRRDNKAPFFLETEVRNLLWWSLEYLSDEHDLRGYVPDKGWAHALAHAADVLLALAKNQHIGAPDLERLMTGIADKIAAPIDHIYVYDEDERLAAVALAALRRGLLTVGFLDSWLERCVQPLREDNTDGFDPALHAAQRNARNLLRSLYICLALDGKRAKPERAFQHKLLEMLKPDG